MAPDATLWVPRMRPTSRQSARGYAGIVTSVRTLRTAHAGVVDYHTAWAEQRRMHEAVVARSEPDTVILLEHPSVYTAGKRTNSWDRPLDGTPVVDVDRGGRITWHGPGQIVGYPILRLPDP